MKHFYFTFLLIAFMSMISNKAQAYDIAVENADGVTIYYNYINEGQELEVTAKSINYDHELNVYGATGYINGGTIKIPSEITISGRTRKVTSIGSYAFAKYSSRLNECGGSDYTIYIPRTIKTIGNGAFLSRHIYNGNNNWWITVKRIIIEDIGAWLNVENNGIATNCTGCCELYSDENTEITNLVIPDGITTIGKNAFRECFNLVSVTIPNSVTTIDDSAFQGCKGFTSITIPNSVTAIGNYAFANCFALKSVTIPNSVTSLGDFAFRGCKFTSITIPDNVTSIGAHTFLGCSELEKVIIKDISTWCTFSFGYYNYYGQNLSGNPLSYSHHIFTDENKEITDLIIPNDVTSIGAFTFDSCSGLTTVTIPNNVTSIGGSAFNECSGLTSVTIPNNVARIGGSAFANCSSLRFVTIGNNVANIERGAFNFTNINGQLVEITSLNEDPTNIDKDAFSSDLYNNASLYVPVGTMEKYKVCTGWKKFIWMEERDVSGVNNVTKTDATEVGRYALDGKRIDEVKHGLNIVRMTDGVTKKVIVK